MILCCGEALIDMLPRTSTLGEDSFAPYPGGAVFNTAVALGRLGVKTGLLTGLSTDRFGDILQSTLVESHVDTGLSIQSSRPTTLAFVHLQDGQASYSFYDENSAMRMLTPDDIPTIPDSINAMVFGCISLVAEPCGQFYQTLMQSEAPSRVMMIDPNIRADFITDEAAYRARIDQMIGCADIIKLSDEDMEWLAPGAAPEQLAQGYIAAGASLVCITQGAAGARGITKDHDLFVPAEKVTAVDTVGAGDTFNAGLLAALADDGNLSKDAIAELDQDGLMSALTLAVRAAAVTVSRSGANPPWRAEL